MSIPALIMWSLFALFLVSLATQAAYKRWAKNGRTQRIDDLKLTTDVLLMAVIVTFVLILAAGGAK